MTILDKLAQHALERVDAAKAKISSDEIKSRAMSLPKGDFKFEKALCGKDIAFICEVKKASPSKGIIAEDFPYLQIAKDYENAGADCISILTEPNWFLGSDEYLREIAENVSIPCLRKDFLVDEYMIYEAKLLGASAVLLIVSIVGDRLKEYIELAHSLGLSALVEIHDHTEGVLAVNSGARIIGVNNRNLKDFSVDVNNSAKLSQLITSNNIIFVAESGIKTSEDVQKLRDIGANAVLIGETLMRSADKKSKLQELRGVK